MTLKSKFICLGATLVIVVFAAEWLNYKNKEISDMQDTSVKVVQRHMDADMKHDGIRGNVYSALVATKTGDGALLKDSQEEVTNMSGEFAKDVQENIASNIPDDIKQQFEKIQKSVEDYASYSQKISHASGGFDGAVAMLPEFNKVFGVLEEGQGKATDMILTWSSKLSDTSQSFAHYLSYVLIAVLVAAIGLPIYAILAIFRPMAAMVNAMKALAGGDASVAIPYTHRTDEMGEMAKALQVFKDNALRIVALSEQSKIEHEHAEKQKRDSMNEIATNFETSVAAVVSQVASAALQMQTGAKEMTVIAEDTKQRSAVVVTASNEAAEMSRHVTQSSEEMMDAIREISSQTQKSSNIAVEASATAERARGTIEALAEKSNNVTEVISVISGIAGQINLLALNATIESARAGEAGKGFAVVASEVKNLANQVAKATGEITTQISEMQEATKSSVASVMQIVSIIDQVTNSASTVASAVEEQSAVMNGIATNVANTSASTQEISRNMTAVQTGAEKTGDTAWEVLEASKSLSEQANVLKAKVDEFLGTIRVA